MNIGIELIKIIDDVKCLQLNDKMIIQDYISHDEWGLAFEVICVVIKNKRLKISHKVFQMIETIGDEMGMNPSLWTHIAQLVSDTEK